MTIDLQCLVANALWGFALVIIEIAGKTRAAGTSWNTGNRDEEPDFPPWVERAGRALSNHKENFPLFLTAVVVVHLSGRAGAVSAIAAIAFVVARVAHGLLYIAGVKGLRTVAWTAGTLSALAVFAQLVV